jgi:hypothetical protein
MITSTYGCEAPDDLLSHIMGLVEFRVGVVCPILLHLHQHRDPGCASQNLTNRGMLVLRLLPVQLMDVFRQSPTILPHLLAHVPNQVGKKFLSHLSIAVECLVL